MRGIDCILGVRKKLFEPHKKYRSLLRCKQCQSPVIVHVTLLSSHLHKYIQKYDIFTASMPPNYPLVLE